MGERVEREGERGDSCFSFHSPPDRQSWSELSLMRGTRGETGGEEAAMAPGEEGWMRRERVEKTSEESAHTLFLATRSLSRTPHAHTRSPASSPRTLPSAGTPSKERRPRSLSSSLSRSLRRSDKHEPPPGRPRRRRRPGGRRPAGRLQRAGLHLLAGAAEDAEARYESGRERAEREQKRRWARAAQRGERKRVPRGLGAPLASQCFTACVARMARAPQAG